MSLKDILLYAIGIGIFVFVSNLMIETQKSLQNDITRKTEVKNTIPQLEQTMLRYDFSSKVLLSNATRKNIAFLIGTMMIILGTILIISKIESLIQTNVDTLEKAKFHLTTSSPGVFVVFLGAIIIITIILKNDSYEFEDAPIVTTEETNSFHPGGTSTSIPDSIDILEQIEFN